MSFSKFPFWREETSNRRVPVDLPCVLWMTNGKLEARICNICFDGVGVELPMQTADFASSDVLAVSADCLGRIAGEMRWRRMNRIGIAFTQAEAVQPQLEQFFRELGRFPD